MPFKGNDFQHTRHEGYVAVLTGRYGHEYDDKLDELVDVENGVRKYWADQLRQFAQGLQGDERTGMMAAVAFLDPYSGQDGPEDQFARTTMTDDPEGAKWITPDVKD